MKRSAFILSALLVSFAFGLSAPAWSYDDALAKSYAEMFEPAKGAAVGKMLHLMSPEKFVEAIKTNQDLVVVDVRTPAEAGIVGSTLPGTLTIPINELFTKDKLNSIPTGKKVVVICKSGTRATAAGTALRHLGFKNVFILKGGYSGLIGYLGPKEANTPVKQAAEK